jgi:hypothetical protein
MPACVSRRVLQPRWIVHQNGEILLTCPSNPNLHQYSPAAGGATHSTVQHGVAFNCNGIGGGLPTNE